VVPVSSETPRRPGVSVVQRARRQWLGPAEGALGLLAKSNPPLFEWLRSPIVYRERSGIVQRLRELSAAVFAPRPCMHHYVHMAEANYREYLRGDVVRVKKYFYVLRPVLACRWIERHGTMPPTEFAAVVADALPPSLQGTIDDLLARKRAGDELAAGPTIPVLNEFLNAEIERMRAVLANVPRTPAPDWEGIDAFFRSALEETWPRA
jgi:predicted nucleotidyltransferase